MPYCPNCSSEVAHGVEKCPTCGALFGPATAWKPVELPPLRPEAGSGATPRSDNHAGRRSFFTRHWTGELPLSVSFWINGVLLNLGLTFVLLAVPWGELTPQSPRLASVGIVILWPLSAAIGVWQLIGIWRSASNYLSQGKSKTCGYLAKIAVVLGFVRTIFEFFFVGVPQLNQFALIALGHDPLGTYELRIVGDELKIEGAIVFGLTDNVAKVLDANPAIQIVQLNSAGGRTGEARRLRDLIDSRGLTTSTTKSCLSACTVVFLAGKQRLIAKGAQLGFHQYAFHGVQDKDLRPQIEKDKADWLARGVAKAMVDRAFATPPNEMWLPTQKELFDYGVVSGYLPDS